MPKLTTLLAVLLLTLVLPGAAGAEEAATASEEETVSDPALVALLAKEKEARKACKIDICSIMLGKAADGPDVSCPIVKTWPKDDITKLMKRTKVKWPWGNTTCHMDVVLKRSMLVSAMTEAKYEAVFDEHQLVCDIAREGEDNYSFKIAMTPSITFENGKATEAYVTWGALEAPSVAKSVLWPATALDNQINVLGSEVVEAVNTFVEKKCLEVKDELKLN
ncbi:MAG: hypothetical protein R3D57_01195 [Hyphomicrobiaceae bacterium]